MHGSGILYFEAKREFEKRFIIHVLKANKGNQCRAARELGLHRNTLSRNLALLRVDAREFRDSGRRPAQKVEERPYQQGGKVSA
jgi:DNA-binding NtrC family response regulator